MYVWSDVRQQLGDQLRCLDTRLDSHVSLLADLHDFYRRRAEVELEYSRSMDKLVRQVTSRHKTERLRYIGVYTTSTDNHYTAFINLFLLCARLPRRPHYGSCPFAFVSSLSVRLYVPCRETWA